MKKIVAWYRLLNILSIDVAIGASVCAMFFAKLSDVEVSILPIVILGLSVWLIYTFDHLRDASELKMENKPERYTFHQKYRKPLSWIILFIGLGVIFLLNRVNQQILLYGTVLGMFTILYFLILNFRKKSWYVKELIIALIYSLGILLVPIVYVKEVFQLNLVLAGAHFFLLVLVNLLLFAWYEYDEDSTNEFPSLVRSIGLGKTRNIMIVLLIAIQLLVITNFWFINLFPALVLFLMSQIMTLLFVFPQIFRRFHTYRLVGDGIFLIPSLILL